jgi:hypothetical protein
VDLDRNRCYQLLLLLTLTVAVESPMQAATSTATVTANIVRPISLDVQNGLKFADITAEKIAGTVVLNPKGLCTTTGGTGVKSSVAAKPAEFKVQGKPNAVYSIRLPKSIVLNGSGGSTLVVDTFTSLPAISGLINADGKQTLLVGATLNVGSHQAYGPYAGTMPVIVEYN